MIGNPGSGGDDDKVINQLTALSESCEKHCISWHKGFVAARDFQDLNTELLMLLKNMLVTLKLIWFRKSEECEATRDLGLSFKNRNGGECSFNNISFV